MKAAVLVFLTASIFAAALVLGLLRLGSSGQPPPAIVLDAWSGGAVLTPQSTPDELVRAEVRERIEHTTLSAIAP